MKEGWLITPALNELPQVQLEKQEEQDGFIKVCQEILKRQQNNKNNARLLEYNTEKWRFGNEWIWQRIQFLPLFRDSSPSASLSRN